MTTERICDLHLHSNCSDGTLAPRELVSLAKEKGLGAIALTDHNTVKGLDDFLFAGKEAGIETTPGIEITAEYGGKEVHIVGLFLGDRARGAIAQFLAEQVERKKENNRALVERLVAGGYEISMEAVEAEAAGAVANRVHVAKVLMKTGAVSSVKEAFGGILAEGGGFYIPGERAKMGNVVSLLHENGAVTVLAHPYLNLTEEELIVCLPETKERGLDAIEVEYRAFSPDEKASARALVERFGLLSSGGSDFHGANKPDVKIAGDGDFGVPYAYYEALRTRAKEYGYED